MPLGSTFPPIEGKSNVVSRRPPTPDYVTKIRAAHLNTNSGPIREDATHTIPDQQIIDLDNYSVDESNLDAHVKRMDISMERIKSSGMNKLIMQPKTYEYDFGFLLKGINYSTTCKSPESIRHLILENLLNNNWLGIIKAMWSRITHELDRLYSNKSDSGHRLWLKVDESHPNLAEALNNLKIAVRVVWYGTSFGKQDQIVFLFDEYFNFVVPALSSRYLNPLSSHYTDHCYLDVVKAFLGTILNLAQNLEYSISVMKEKDVKQILVPYRNSGNYKMKTTTLLILSYLTTDYQTSESNVKELTDNEVAYLINGLKTSLSSSTTGTSKSRSINEDEVVKALSRLASVDAYKAGMVTHGLIPLLVKCLDNQCDVSLKKAAADALWALSFHSESRQMMRESPECLDRLRVLAENEDTMDEASGALWKIHAEEKHLDVAKKCVKPDQKQSSDRYIMISYEWNVQPQALQLKERLEKVGFRIWIDTEQMNKTGNVLDGMATAVAGADAIIMCLTERYKERNATRSEAEYAWKLEKKFFPVRMQPKYTASGWLSLLLGATFWYDLTKPDQYDQKISDLIKALQQLYKPSQTGNVTQLARAPQSVGLQQGLIPKPVANVKTITVPLKSTLKCAKWTTEEVKKFLKDSGLDTFNKVEMTGDMLSELILLKYEVPQHYYTILKDELGLSWLDTLRFNSVISTLFG